MRRYRQEIKREDSIAVLERNTAGVPGLAGKSAP